MDSDSPSLTTRCYDGVLIVTTDHADAPLAQARQHRWTVRAHLLLTGTNRLEIPSDWKEH